MTFSEQPDFQLSNLSTQAMRTLVRRLSAYLPVTLIRQLLHDGLPQTGVPHRLTAATMFADMSGFSQMAEALAVEGPRGAEELNRTLLMTFTALVNAIHDAGGAVSHFHGDAMMVYFPDADGQAAARALAAARFMQSLMLTSLSQVQMARLSERSRSFDLTIKIGVGYGRCVELIVGEPGVHLEFVLGGTAVDEAVLAQQQAAAGEVVASRNALQAAGFFANEAFRVVTEVVPVPRTEAGIYWEAYEMDTLHNLLTAVPAFMPQALFERLLNRNTQFVAEHRTVTSLFLQFEGLDFAAENVGELLQQYYLWVWDVVRRYGGKNGRVNRVLTGDKGNQFHILFGAPVAPDAPEQAIRCALALQAGKPEFISCQRIGMTAGRVFAGAVGSQNRREYTVVGPVVNLSARLTQHCPENAILVDGHTVNRTRTEIDFVEHAAIQMKGWVESVPIFQVLGERARPNQLQTRFTQWETPPVGRENELQTLMAAMDRALQGAGGIVAIHSSFGGGQMPFLSAGVRHWLGAGGRGFVGSCQQHQSDVWYAPWLTIWRDFFNLIPDMNTAVRTARVLTVASELCPDCGDDIELWREPLGLISAAEKLRPMPALVRQSRFFAMCQQMLANAAHRQPVLLILEDLQWADQMSLDLLDELARIVADHPLLIVVTFHHAAYLPVRALTREETVRILLEDLPPQEARHFVREQLGGGDLPLAVEQWLGLRDRQGNESAVNPLFLEESLKAMMESGVLWVDEDAYGNGRVRVDETRLAQMQVPDSIYAIMLGRLDQLSAASRNLLQVAAVVGREFDLKTLNWVVPKSERESVADLLDELVAADMLMLVAFEPSPVYMFQHTVLHDVVYQSLPFARRQSLHNQIAEYYLTDQAGDLPSVYGLLAYHLGQTNQHEAGLKYALLAAEDAQEHFAYRAAAEFYRQALTHLLTMGIEAHWETAVTIYTQRARLLHAMGQLTQAIASASNALQFCQEHKAVEQTWALLNLIAEVRCTQGDYRAAVKVLLPFENRTTNHVPLPAWAHAWFLRARCAVGENDLADALYWLEQAEELCLTTNNEAQLTLVLALRAQVRSEQGELDTAVDVANTAVRRAQTVSDATVMGYALRQQARVLARAGQMDAALAAVQEAVNTLRNINKHALVGALIRRATIYACQARYAAARLDLKMSEELLLGMDDVPCLLDLYAIWSAELLGPQGAWAQAEAMLNKAAFLLDRDVLFVRERTIFTLARAEVAYHLGHYEAVASNLEAALKLIQKYDLRWYLPKAHYVQGLTRHALCEDKFGDDNGRIQLIASLKAVQEGGCPDELPLILLRLAQYTPEDSEKRWHYFEACVAAAHERARHHDRQICFAEAGAVLAKSSDERLRRIGAGCLAWVDSIDAG